MIPLVYNKFKLSDNDGPEFPSASELPWPKKVFGADFLISEQPPRDNLGQISSFPEKFWLKWVTSLILSFLPLPLLKKWPTSSLSLIKQILNNFPFFKTLGLPGKNFSFRPKFNLFSKFKIIWQLHSRCKLFKRDFGRFPVLRNPVWRYLTVVIFIRTFWFLWE